MSYFDIDDIHNALRGYMKGKMEIDLERATRVFIDQYLIPAIIDKDGLSAADAKKMGARLYTDVKKMMIKCAIEFKDEGKVVFDDIRRDIIKIISEIK